MSYRPKVKVCGITNLQDALSLSDLEIDYLGFIVNYETSPRYLPVADALKIVKEVKLRRPDMKLVAVLVDPSEIFIEEILVSKYFDVLQLHGSESPDFCEGLLGRGVEIWKAVIVNGEEDLTLLALYDGRVNKILVDSGKGTGNTAPWNLLKGQNFQILAGGLNPENTAEAVKLLHPEVVDLNSGVESEPGKKDRTKVEKVIQTLEALV